MKWRQTLHGQLATEADELSSQGFHGKALEVVERALQFAPEDPILLVYYGRELRELSRNDDAEKTLRSALRLDETLHVAWSQLGMLMQSRKEYEKAAFCYERSADISANASILTMLANMQLAFDPWKSFENAERALAIDPGWSEALVIKKSAQKEI